MQYIHEWVYYGVRLDGFDSHCFKEWESLTVEQLKKGALFAVGFVMARRFLFFQLVSFLILVVTHIHVFGTLYKTILEALFKAWVQEVGPVKVLGAIFLGLIAHEVCNLMEYRFKSTSLPFTRKRTIKK